MGPICHLALRIYKGEVINIFNVKEHYAWFITFCLKVYNLILNM